MSGMQMCEPWVQNNRRTFHKAIRALKKFAEPE